ncbi:hypothetical protein EV363DRAFT_1346780 [Boletus edulis]|nr:hypothetical protein EV363DRAFT_1346780 [Boletus edulis]
MLIEPKHGQLHWPSHIVFGPVMHSRVQLEGTCDNSVFSNCAKWRLSEAKRTNLEVTSPRVRASTATLPPLPHCMDRGRILWLKNASCLELCLTLHFYPSLLSSMQPARVWLTLSTTVTGASSGFGKALTEVVLRKGDIVVATLRKPSVLATLTKQYPPSQLLLLALDVTRPSDISAAFTRTQEVFGRLDVVFNNAGYGYFGEVEAIPDENARALLEVNFWGAVGVSRAAVKFFREVNAHGKGGILLQNSSMLGISGGPGVTLEGFTDSFSKEIPPEWNIKICILQPGSFDTKLLSGTFFAPHPAYGNSATVTRRDFYRNVVPEGDPYKFAEMLHQLVVGADEGEKMPFFLPIGEDALAKLRHRLKRMGKTLVDVTPLSTDMKKDGKKAKTMAKL